MVDTCNSRVKIYLKGIRQSPNSAMIILKVKSGYGGLYVVQYCKSVTSSVTKIFNFSDFCNNRRYFQQSL